MILVTLGTQDKKFYRLLEAIDRVAPDLSDEIIVQAGTSSDYQQKSGKLKILDLIPMDEFDKLISQCEILITHGGVGSIITGLKSKKKVIAAARLEKYGEHENDHQLQIIENFTKEGYILCLDDFNNLMDVIIQAQTFEPKTYISNTDSFVSLISKEIDKYLV